MSTTGDSDRERRLDEIIAAYLQAVDTGKAPDRQELLKRHPDLAEELQEFFDGEDRFSRGSSAAGTSQQKPPAVPLGKGDDLGLRPAEARRESIHVGSVIVGQYRVFDVKSGGMGRVYLAEDLDAGKSGFPLKVAIKTVADFGEWQQARAARGASADGALYTNLLARFRREAMAWVRLGMHPNIIWAMWVIEVGAKPYLVMEYADSGDLREWISPLISPCEGETKEGSHRLTIPLTLNFAIQFCEGMKHAVATSGLVHRDIKPANVLIKDNRILKITDFGLAKAYQDIPSPAPPADVPAPVATSGNGGRSGRGCSDSYDLSAAGAGTRAYMAPEQFRSLRRADTRSDIFSFGAMLYEMLTGVQLFAPMNAAEMARLGAPILGAHEIGRSVPPELSAIVAQCLAYDPARRYQSFEDLHAALSRINEALPEKLPMPIDARHAGRAALLTPSLAILGETYSLISLGRYEDAAACAQRGIDIAPNDFQHWLNKGKALSELGDREGALQCSKRATELKPDDARSWSNLGWGKLQLGDAPGGREAALRAIQVDPEFGEAWMCRGMCERELGQTSEAVQSLRRAAELEPHNWKTHANLGSCLKDDLRRYAEAFDAFVRALEINPRFASGWRDLAWLHASVRSWEEARGAVDKCLELSPSNADAWAIRAWVLWSGEGDTSNALEALQRCLDLEPANHGAQVILEAIRGSADAVGARG